MDASEDLHGLAERLRETGALGRSATLQSLFEFLLERSGAGVAPKEVEVAEAVFGRGAGFDVSQDSSVRVYIHRLRRKLDDYYAGAGASEPVRLAVPMGEYRLVAIKRDVEDDASPPTSRRFPRWVIPAIAGLVCLNLILGGLWLAASHNRFVFAARSPAWSGLFQGARPVTLVVGDYFIFGEMDDHANVTRLIREYSINSPEDLSHHLMDNPHLLPRYTNLDLHYLPVSIAPALRELAPMLEADRRMRSRLHVITASDLTPDMLKQNDIVYVGYLSGLDLLREPVLAGSRFRIGQTYDELIDQTNNRVYASQEGGPEVPGETRRDYGYFSTFEGPSGNTIVVVAGARDVGLMQLAEIVSSRDGLQDLKRQVGKASSFEALYEVEGVNRVNLRGRLLLASPLKQAR